VIKLRPSRIIIPDYEPGDNKTLEYSLSVWDQAIYNYSFRALNFDIVSGGLVINRGYDLDKLCHLLGEKIVNETDKHYEWRKVLFRMKFPPRDIKQQDALNFLSGDSEYFDYMKNEPQKMLCLKTGGGKTYCAISHIQKSKKATIIFVDKDIRLDQWQEEFLKFTTIDKDHIYIISGSDSIKKLLNEKPSHKIYLASIRTIMSYAKGRLEKLGDLFQYLGIGLKIFDEAHVELNNIFLIDTSVDVSETIYLTATPGRSDPKEDIVYKRMYEWIPTYGLESEYRDSGNFLNVILVEFDSKPSLKQQTDLTTKRGFNINGWSDFILNEYYDKFYNMICTLIKTSLQKKPTVKMAIILHKNDFVARLSSDLENDFPDISVGIFSSIIKTNRNDELNKQIIVTTDSSFDKAVDVPDLEIIFNTVQLSSAIKIEQMSGRLRNGKNKRCFYFDFTDIGFPQCKKQKRFRHKVLIRKAKTLKKWTAQGGK
jgi:hypothetical protein